MSTLPDTYKLDKNLRWEDFEVNDNFDDSYRRLNFKDIEYISDIFITYLPGGENLTVDIDLKRRVVLKINQIGHHSYPDVEPGDGYLFTIYNDDLGTAQLGTKPVRLVMATEDYLIFRGYDVLAMGPFGLIDPGNTDYGVAVFLKNRGIRKIAFYRYDTRKCYEYANKSNRIQQLPLTFSDGGSSLFQESDSHDAADISYERVKRNADAFKRRMSTMNMLEKISLARETDRIFNIGARYWNDGDRDTAMKYFAEALDLFPINTDVIGIYGDYFEYSDYDLSMKFYELAISLGSTRKKDFYQLANFYKWKGDYHRADQCYTLWELVKARSGIDSDE